MISFLTIARSDPDSRFEPSNCNTMRQMASPMLSVPLVLDDCCTWRVRRFLGRERGNYHEQERQGGIRRPRAQVQQSNREPPTGPFHAFAHLHTCAFSLISSACFLWQVTASMRRREGQARRRKRPRYTKPATHGRLLASFLASICTPIDF